MLTELTDPLQARLHGTDCDQVQFQRVGTDSRTLQPGDLFVALRGERFDGHQFLRSVCEAGASALLVDEVDAEIDCPQLQVADTTQALGQMARLNRNLYKGPLIALTGSCGKTTVKEMLATVLGQCGRVHVTQGNLNNHIGVPQTLLGMGADTDFAVIEMGASGLGEIDYLASIAQPTVALVNNVMAAHLEGFGSEAGVAREKSTIYRHLKQNGVAVINADEPYAADWCANLDATRGDIRQISFSVTSSEADVYASDIQLTQTGCYRFRVNLRDQSTTVTLPIMGQQNIANALAVISCCIAVGVSLPQIVSGLERVKPVAGRLNPLPGLDGALIIDDSYNANPGSVMAATRLLAGLEQAGREGILILGDLAELGESADESLFKLGQEIQLTGLSQLLTCGNNSRGIAEGFGKASLESQRQRHFSDQQQLIEWVKQKLSKNTVVLVKGSRSSRMEDVVQAITFSGEKV